MYNKSFATIYNSLSYKSSILTPVDVFLSRVKKCNSLLDLGCGTGNFITKISKYFKCMVGIDISPNMIRIAKSNCPSAHFLVGDITHFKLKQKFDVITCNFDVINHLRSFKQWKEVFNNAYNHLKKNGYFFFDFLNYYFYFHNDEIITNDVNYIIKQTIKRCDAHHNKIYTRIYMKDTNEFVINQIVKESCYSNQKIFKALSDAGFKNIQTFNRAYQPLDKEAMKTVKRIFVICQRK